jgi:L-threonylcarbamoyladenylate synthase
VPNSVFVIGDRSSLDAAIDGTAAVLRRGGLAIFPTDTVYVAASVARSGQALSGGIERLFQLKRRGRGPSFPWLVASAADLEVYGRDLTDEALMLATCLWPSGLTLVVRASSAVPRALAREDGTVALRCADSPIASGLLHACAAPLICTGANPHGVATPVTYDEILSEVKATVDTAVVDPNAACKGRSTIVDCTTRPVRLLREGCVPHGAVNEVLGYEMPFV